jgi:hypothetical protein
MFELFDLLDQIGSSCFVFQAGDINPYIEASPMQGSSSQSCRGTAVADCIAITRLDDL